jgi:hypothetical protein
MRNMNTMIIWNFQLYPPLPSSSSSSSGPLLYPPLPKSMHVDCDCEASLGALYPPRPKTVMLNELDEDVKDDMVILNVFGGIYIYFCVMRLKCYISSGL